MIHTFALYHFESCVDFARTISSFAYFGFKVDMVHNKVFAEEIKLENYKKTKTNIQKIT